MLNRTGKNHNLFRRGFILLVKRYGKEGADNAVRNLTSVWISGVHAGLLRILALQQDLSGGVPHEPAARSLILAHFSQRCPNIPSPDEISIQKTCIAFDLMSITIADLPVLPHVLPYLKLLFKKEMTTDISDDVPDATP
ncbi:ZINC PHOSPHODIESTERASE ELAC PROTEIN 2 [Salix purpurea]|uniref:ZINC PHOSPHODIESTERASE ELAC PROTEIN 2 n=1 Tax=Salix purpurea TaxID=77065 RepID=A0A9Q0TT73_SALPP|nr:ZINC PHOSPHODIESTERASE ELAC PROTEIN 2 [Salix purpurea]